LIFQGQVEEHITGSIFRSCQCSSFCSQGIIRFKRNYTI